MTGAGSSSSSSAAAGKSSGKSAERYDRLPPSRGEQDEEYGIDDD
jgi:hypothetical protein